MDERRMAPSYFEAVPSWPACSGWEKEGERERERQRQRDSKRGRERDRGREIVGEYDRVREREIELARERGER